MVTFQRRRQLALALLALVIAGVLYFAPRLLLRTLLATTPAKYGLSKPAELILFLPWRDRDARIMNGYGSGWHDGSDYYSLDFDLPAGWPIYPVAPGRVIGAGRAGGGNSGTLCSYGNFVMIDHGNGYQSLYAHLSAENVSPGQTVSRETPIGTVGRTGCTDDAHPVHLHFALRKDAWVCNSPLPNPCYGPTGGTAVVPEPFVGREVYEGFGLTWVGHNLWPGPLSAVNPPADSAPGIPRAEWGLFTTDELGVVMPGEPIHYEVKNLPSDTKEVRLTAGYYDWSSMVPDDDDAVWRIVARCWPDRPGENGCSWRNNNSTLVYDWYPHTDRHSAAPWLPSDSYVNLPSQPLVCISFDVFDHAGNASYASGGLHCPSSFNLSASGLAADGIGAPLQDNAQRVVYVEPVASDTDPLPDPTTWLLEFSKAERPPLEVEIHIRVEWTDNYDAFRICFDGTNCQETSATELYYTWNTNGWADGNHTLRVQYRRLSDGGDWANALVHEEQYYLSPDRSGVANCDGGEGAYLRSGGSCIRLTADQRELATLGWADRSDLLVSVVGAYEAWVYDDVDYQGYTRLVHSGEERNVGGNVSSIDLEPASPPPPPLPTTPFTCDGDAISVYHLDAGMGTTVVDACGRVQGTIQDSNVSWTLGKYLSGLSFPNPPDGRGITMGAPAAFDLCPMSVEMWVKRTGSGRMAGQLGGNGNTGQNKWLLSLDGDRPRLEIWAAGGSQGATSYRSMSADEWHLLMFSYDCATTGKLYLDNELVGTVTTAGVWPSGATTFEIGSAEGIARFQGAIDEVRISNAVRLPGGPPPSAAFSAAAVTGTAPLGVAFQDESTGNILNWQWDFGDGTSSTMQNPVHYYNTPGQYDVQLLVTGPAGSDTQLYTDYVQVSPAQPSPWLLVHSAAVAPQGPLTTSWSDLGTSGNDLLRLHPLGANDATYLYETTVSDERGSLVITAPATEGWYELGLYRDGLRVATSNPFETRSHHTFLPLLASSPPVPQVELVTRLEGDAEEVTIRGTYAYVMLDAQLVVLDISNPSSPVPLGSSAPVSGTIEDLVVEDQYAYLANGEQGLRIFDVADPMVPREIAHLDTAGLTYGIAIAGDYAFVADGPEILLVVDITNRHAPIPAASYGWPCRFAYGILVSGDRAYLGGHEFYTFDISDPLRPVLLGSYSPTLPEGFTRKGIRISGGVAFTGENPIVPPGTGGGLRAIDVSDPGWPRAIGFYDTLGDALGVALSEGFAYVADGYEGILTVDVRNPLNLVPVALNNTEGYAEEVDVIASYVLVADNQGGLLIFRRVG